MHARCVGAWVVKQSVDKQKHDLLGFEFSLLKARTKYKSFNKKLPWIKAQHPHRQVKKKPVKSSQKAVHTAMVAVIACALGCAMEQPSHKHTNHMSVHKASLDCML